MRVNKIQGKQLFNCIFENVGQYEYEETPGLEVDGISVLGRVKGEFSFDGQISENGYYYKEGFWPDILSDDEVRDKIGNHLMYGMIGHRDEPVSDVDLSSGEVSHIISKISINENGTGSYEGLILGTSSGKNLHTYFKARSKLRPSTRAWGTWGEDSKGRFPEKEGFYFDTIDFVRFPGIKQTTAEMFEHQENKSDINEDKETFMDPEKIMEMLQKSQDECATLRSKIAILESDKNSLSSERDSISESLKGAEKKTKSISESLRGLLGMVDNKIFEENKSLSDEEIVRELTKTFKVLKSIGKPEEVQEALRTAGKALSNYTKTVGKINEAKLMASEIVEYRKIGKPAEITKAIQEAKKVIDSYLKFGPVSKVQESVAYATKVKAKINAMGAQKMAESVSKKLNIPLETALPLVQKVGISEAKKLLGTEGKSSKTPKTPIQEDNKTLSFPTGTTGAATFFESMSK